METSGIVLRILMSDPRASIARFLASQTLGVLSTANDEGQPQAALVAFSETPDLQIVIGTFEDTRKFANLLQNQHVAFVVSSDKKTVQIEGIARMAQGDELERCRARHSAKNPASVKYAHDPKQRFFIIEPTWMRFSDHTTDPHTIEEFPC